MPAFSVVYVFIRVFICNPRALYRLDILGQGLDRLVSIGSSQITVLCKATISSLTSPHRHSWALLKDPKDEDRSSAACGDGIVHLPVQFHEFMRDRVIVKGATPTQARAALRQYKDVMQAAEQFLEGKFDHITDDDGGVAPNPVVQRTPRPAVNSLISERIQDQLSSQHRHQMTSKSAQTASQKMEKMVRDFLHSKTTLYQPITDADYMDYDYDFEIETDGNPIIADIDPYSGSRLFAKFFYCFDLNHSQGIFFSKDRREEVIEVEEEAEVVDIPEIKQRVKLMTQGQWMKGCPEGGEQSFLFSLYSELSEGTCMCPHGCGRATVRRKANFFAIYVSVLPLPRLTLFDGITVRIFDIYPTTTKGRSAEMHKLRS